jgi:ribosomal protein L16 Arg81 hydroxylase
MPTETFDFARLLGPLEADQFFAEFWERKYLHLKRSQPHYYQSLICAADLEKIISDSDARYPAIRLAKGGGYFAPETYTRDVKHGDESFTGIPDVKRISDEYRRGATVALPAIQRTWKPLGLLCDALQRELDHAVHANIYITPGNASGFTPHYDTHEVFVLQVAGSKRWSIYEPSVPLPHRGQPFTPHAYSGQPPIGVVDLEPGDLLYLPRGFLHSTTTAHGFSAHVTIGVTVYTWADVIRQYLQAGNDVLDLRRSLPPGFASKPELKTQVVDGLAAGLERLRTEVDSHALIDVFTERVLASRVPRPEPFRVDVKVVEATTMLSMPAATTYRYSDAAESGLLEFNGVRYQLPAPVASTFRAMVALQRFRPAELPAHLSPEGNLGFSRQLVDVGFLSLDLSRDH